MTVPGGNGKRLIFKVTDHTDTGAPVQIFEIAVEFGTKRDIGDIVDAGHRKSAHVDHSQSPAPGAEVRMIICPVKQVTDAVVLRHNAEKTAHELLLLMMREQKNNTILIYITRRFPQARF